MSEVEPHRLSVDTRCYGVFVCYRHGILGDAI